MRLFNFALALVFLILALVQVNAPYPLYQIFLFGTVSVLCILAMFDFYRWKAQAIAVVAVTGYLFYRWSAFLLNELTVEFTGMLGAWIVLVLQWVVALKKK
jgi:hypothetical protein